MPLGALDLAHDRLVAVGVGPVLVGGEQRAPVRDQALEVARVLVLGAAQEVGQPLRHRGREPAPGEGGPVGLDRDAVQLHRPLDRAQRERH